MTKHCPRCGEQIHDANAKPKSQLVRMRITDAEKERVLVIPPRRRTEVLLAECNRLAANAKADDILLLSEVREHREYCKAGTLIAGCRICAAQLADAGGNDEEARG